MTVVGYYLPVAVVAAVPGAADEAVDASVAAPGAAVVGDLPPQAR